MRITVCNKYNHRWLCHRFLSRDLLFRALNGRILKIFMWKYLNESNNEMNKLSFQIIWCLTWSIGDRNSWSHQSDTWNNPFFTIAEFPSTSSWVVMEEPPISISVHSLLFIDGIISIGTYGFIYARINFSIPCSFTLCLNFQLSSILNCNFEINLEMNSKNILGQFDATFLDIRICSDLKTDDLPKIYMKIKRFDRKKTACRGSLFWTRIKKYSNE